jgi:hypothetical protein
MVISELLSSILLIMFWYMYTCFLYQRNIFSYLYLFTSMVCRSVIRWSYEQFMCMVDRWLCTVFVRCFANSYAGAFFQLMSGLMGMFGSCSFIVAHRFRAVGVMFVCFHVFFMYGVVTLF